jgi:outer membrane receptor protein involved in Fe transport
VIATLRAALVCGITALLLSGPAAPPAEAAQDTTGTGGIAGTVKSASGEPAAGVRVCALGSAGCAITAADGSFRIADLRTGDYQLEVIPAEGLPIVSDPVPVRAGLDGRVEITLAPQTDLQQTVTVTAPAFRVPEEVKTSGFLVEPTEILRSAGALQDVSRYLQTLPGVVIGNNDFRNDIIVRGGSPLENLFVIDNVEIPNINAFANFASAGGTVSILDAQLIQDVTFLTGGYPAPYINRTSSVLQVAQREGDRQQFRGWATVGFAGAGTILEGPINGGKGSWIVSARRSFLDIFTQDVGFGGVPVLYTLNAKAVYDVTDRDRVWVVNVAGVDDIRLGRTDDTPNDDEVYNFDIRYEGSRSATGVNWQRLFGSRGVGLLGVTSSVANTNQQVKDLVAGGVPPAGATTDDIIAAAPVVFSDDSRERETTVKYDLTIQVPFFQKLQAGGSAKVFNLRYETASPSGTDSPYAPEPNTNPFDVRTSFTAYQTGAYLQATRDIGSRLNVTLGGRVDDYQYLNRTTFSPRASAAVRMTDTLSWRASYGQYFQQPFFLFLSAFPENRSLIPWRADHYVTGIAWQPGGGWRATLEGYYKDYRDYPVARDYPSLSLANVGDTFNVREILFPLLSTGDGYAQGVELFVEKRRTGKLYGQANLAFSKTRHAGLDGVLRPGSFDYPFVANAVGGYRLTPKWEVSTRLAWLAGRPYTPYDEATSTAQRRGVYDLTQVNALRAPNYIRIDVRVDRTFQVNGSPLIVFAGIQNVTNRQNFAGVQWNRATNAAYVEDQQGIFPILGLEWRF